MQLKGRSGAALARLDQVAAAGPVLAGAHTCCRRRCTAGAASRRAGAARAARARPVPGRRGPPAEIAALDQALAARKARTIALPADLPADPRRSTATSRHDAAGSPSASRPHAANSRRCAAAWFAGRARQLALAAWLVTHVPELPVTEHFAWVTGWCADPDDSRLRAALDARTCTTCCAARRHRRTRCRRRCCAIQRGRGPSRCSAA